MLDETSLAATLDAVNEALFLGKKITQRDRAAVAKWLAGRCNQPRSYESMPAPTDLDFAAAPRLFTGEPLTTGGGTACKLGNEGCRALILLDVHTRAVTDALQQAEERMTARLDPAGGPRGGYYCCGSCTVAFWRHLLVGGLDHQEERLANGLQNLRKARLGNGGWRFFPSWYTVWAVTEMGLRAFRPTAVRDELQYVAARLERAYQRAPKLGDVYALRRQEIARRALALA
jgi:hypothetical protein